MGYLVDTSVVAAWVRQQLSPEAIVAQVGNRDVALSAITAAELLRAVHSAGSAQRRWRRQAFVESLLTTLPVLPLDSGVARTYSRLIADLSAVGASIRSHELMIAATALTHGLALATCSPERFEQIDGLELTEWSASPSVSPRPSEASEQSFPAG